ncbi:hypothetical protein [Nonomuraea sp. NPDC048826]|uniref:hypothetical protein n=1 Tax=Nonomuraea sp. NPDC048826 TaxID=3364347 RepID=UPI00371771AC
MFFDPPPAREEVARPPHPALPEWFAPPAAELGSTLASDRVLARSPHVAVALTGVRYADGAKATTVEGDPGTSPEPPTAPRISWIPGGGPLRSGQSFGVNALALWLWPLPPPEPFELAVEWPLGGIGLTITELDGGPVGAAARRSAAYWP